MSYLVIIITFIFINNFIFVKFLGLCPFIGVSKKRDSAIGMGFAVIFVMAISSLVTSSVYQFILMPLGLGYLKTIVFILVIASLVQFVEMVIAKFSPQLYHALGIYLPLITTNCAVLGIALLNVESQHNVFESFIAGVSAGIGFFIALILMSAVRERIERQKNLPRALRGAPIAFLTAGLMALAFMAFDNALLKNLLG